MNFKQMVRICGLVIILICGLLISCGPSAEEQTATSVALTATAATETPTPTLTPTVTSTSTNTPTATPVPEPDASAMINWEGLNLPSGYTSLDPHELGFGEGDWIMGAQLEDGTQLNFYIESSFIFAKKWPEAAYGWTAIYPTEFDRELLDWYIDNFQGQLAGIVTENFQGSLISVIDNTEYSHIGDNSAEAWAVYTLGSNFWTYWGAAFRIDDIGGFVFLRHSFGDEQFIEIGDLAQIYAQSIEIPINRCKFASISPDLDSDVPAYEYKVEGFYPGEPLMVGLTGDVIIDGETKRVTAADYDTDNADELGEFHGRMTFGVEVDEILPSEFELMILGQHSKCEVNQVFAWPSE